MKYVFEVIAAIVLALFLAGCSGDPKTDWIARLAVTCDSYASTLTVLAARRSAGTLSAKQVRVVNDARVLVNPVCLPGSDVPDARTAFLRVNSAVNQLVTMKGAQ